MAITDLTGTTWTLNSSLTSYAGGSYSLKTYVVDITTDPPMSVYSGTTDTFAAIVTGYDSGAEHNIVNLYTAYPISYDGVAPIANGSDTKSLPDPWQYCYSGTLTFTGGTDVTNSALIAWVEDNCTEVAQPTVDVIVTYEGENIVELSDSDTKTLKTQGKYLTDDIVLKYMKSGSGSGAQTAHVEYYPVDQCYYTDATMTVVHQSSAGPVNDDLPIGSLLIDVFDVWVPTAAPTNCTLVTQKVSAKNGGYYIYEVTG